MKSISMRDLQKISAKTIQSLPHPVPIKSGTATVGVLMPLQRSNQDGLRRLLEQVDRATAAYTPEQTAAIDAIALERGID